MQIFKETRSIFLKKSSIAICIWVVWQFLILWSNSLLWRFLWPTDLGVFSLINVLVWSIVLIAWLWLSSWIVRYMPLYQEKKNNALAHWYIIFASVMSIIASVIGALVLYFFSWSIAQFFWWWAIITYGIQIAAFLIPIRVLSNLFKHYFLSQKNIVLYYGNTQILEPIVLAIIIAVGWFFWIDFLWFFALYIWWLLLILLFEYWYIRYKYIPVLHKNYTFHITDWLHFSIPLVFWWVTYFFLNRADTVIVGRFLWTSAVWVYTAAFVIAHLLMVGKSALQVLFLPTIAQLHAQKNTNQIQQLFTTVSGWIFLIMFPLWVIFSVYSKDWIQLFYWEQFIVWSWVLQILILWVLLNFTSWLTAALLKLHKKTITLSMIILIATICNVLLNLIFVDIYGMLWVAFWTMLWFIVCNIMLLWHSRAWHNWKFHRRVIIMSIGVSLWVYIWVYLIHLIRPIHFLVQVSIFIILYWLFFRKLWIKYI